MATVAQINTKIDEAVTLIEAEDWSLALTKLMAAQALLAGKADSKVRNLSELTYDREGIASLIRNVREELRLASRSAFGIKTSTVKYVSG